MVAEIRIRVESDLGVVVLIAFLSVFMGCGGDGGKGETAREVTQEGWRLFELGKHQEALEKFQIAVGIQPTYADAHNGMGWCYAVLDQFGDAIESFQSAIDNGIEVADPYAGKALVYRDYTEADQHFEKAIVSAELALSISRRYCFAHDPDLDWKDLMLVLAQCHYALTNYDLANAWVDSLPDGVPVNPTSPNFVADLAAEIERLGSLYASR